MKTYPNVRELIRSKIMLNSAVWGWVHNTKNHHHILSAMIEEGFEQDDWVDYIEDVTISYNQHNNLLSILVCVNDYNNESWHFFITVTPEIEEELQKLAYKVAADGDATKFYAPSA